MKKSFIQGFVAGALVFGGAVSFATNYEALTATFPILINGEKWTSDKPIVVVEGSTYLPLKAIGEALNVKVNWNNELHQVEIGEVKNESSEQNDETKESEQKITKEAIDSAEEENAIKFVNSRLRYWGYSRQGLIYDLEDEGFSHALAVKVVDSMDINWKTQAVKAAKTKLKYFSYSRASLIEALEDYEYFDHEQAVYGAERALAGFED